MDSDTRDTGSSRNADGRANGRLLAPGSSSPPGDVMAQLDWDADRDGAPGGSPGDANLVEIIGTVVTQRWRGRDSIALSGMSPAHARTARLALQVTEEDGDAYGIRLVCAQQAPGVAALLAQLQDGDRIRVAGRLGWRATYDLRYATPDDPAGRPVRELLITVLALEPALPDAIDGSWVRVQGTILVPPRLRWHEVVAGMQVARTSLQVALHQPSLRPGSRCAIVQTETIPVDFPIDLPGVGAALRVGNQVVVEGRLELFRQRINAERAPQVGVAVATLRQALAAELAGLADEARSRVERRGAGQVRRLLYEDRLRLRAGYVALLGGHPVDDLDQVVAQHRAWVRDQQARRDRRQQRQAIGAATGDGQPPDAGNLGAVAPGSPAQDQPSAQAPLIRHRQLAAPATAVAGPEDIGAPTREGSAEPLSEQP